MKRKLITLALLLGAPLLIQKIRAQAVATGVSGLYGTGFTTSGTAITQGTTSASAAWSVTGDIANGVSASKFLGTSYVVLGSVVSGDNFVANQSSGSWITAPGATANVGSYPANDSTGANQGGIYLPGEGTSYASNGSGGYYQEGVYVYTLTFTITGTAGQAVSNFKLNLTTTADDTFSVYINPTTSAGIPTSTAAYTSSGTYDPMSSTNLSIAYNSSSAPFVLGTNKLEMVVDNTANVVGASSDNQTTGSGLLVYDLNATVPEVLPWVPAAGAVLAYAARLWFRRRRPRCEAAHALKAGLSA